jgi:hypothetical protein
LYIRTIFLTVAAAAVGYSVALAAPPSINNPTVAAIAKLPLVPLSEVAKQVTPGVWVVDPTANPGKRVLIKLTGHEPLMYMCFPHQGGKGCEQERWWEKQIVLMFQQ